MKRSFILGLVLLGLTACELPDVEGMNSAMKTMPDTTKEMGHDMKSMKQATHLLTLSSALEGINKYENQQLIAPLPTGFMAFGKVFAEEATTEELLGQTDVWLREIEEIMPASGLDKDGAATEASEVDLQKARLQKTARLYSAMLIAGFAQDEKIEQIIQEDIFGRGRYEKAALQLLALRGFFYREIMLKTSLKVDTSSPELLSNSGMMNKAIEYLLKLEKISRLEFADIVEVHLKEKYHNLIEFEESQNAEGRAQTAAIWQVALEKAQAGFDGTKRVNYTNNERTNQAAYEAEQARQKQAISVMKSYVDSWNQNP